MFFFNNIWHCTCYLFICWTQIYFYKVVVHKAIHVIKYLLTVAAVMPKQKARSSIRFSLSFIRVKNKQLKGLSFFLTTMNTFF